MRNSPPVEPLGLRPAQRPLYQPLVTPPLSAPSHAPDSPWRHWKATCGASNGAHAERGSLECHCAVVEGHLLKADLYSVEMMNRLQRTYADNAL
jgi:hypothetical protein